MVVNSCQNIAIITQLKFKIALEGQKLEEVTLKAINTKEALILKNKYKLMLTWLTSQHSSFIPLVR